MYLRALPPLASALCTISMPAASASWSSPLPHNRCAQNRDKVIEIFARVQLGNGDEEVVVMTLIELPQRNAAKYFLMLEIGQNFRGRKRRPHYELVVNRTAER